MHTCAVLFRAYVHSVTFTCHYRLTHARRNNVKLHALVDRTLSASKFSVKDEDDDGMWSILYLCEPPRFSMLAFTRGFCHDLISMQAHVAFKFDCEDIVEWFFGRHVALLRGVMLTIGLFFCVVSSVTFCEMALSVSMLENASVLYFCPRPSVHLFVHCCPLFPPFLCLQATLLPTVHRALSGVVVPSLLRETRSRLPSRRLGRRRRR